MGWVEGVRETPVNRAPHLAETKTLDSQIRTPLPTPTGGYNSSACHRLEKHKEVPWSSPGVEKSRTHLFCP